MFEIKVRSKLDMVR